MFLLLLVHSFIQIGLLDIKEPIIKRTSYPPVAIPSLSVITRRNFSVQSSPFSQGPWEKMKSFCYDITIF